MMRLLSFEYEVASIVVRIVRLRCIAVSIAFCRLAVVKLTFIAIVKPFSASVHAANSEPRKVSRFWRKLSAERTIVGGATFELQAHCHKRPAVGVMKRNAYRPFNASGMR